MVRLLLGFILGASVGAIGSYYYMRPYSNAKYEIMDCLSEDVRNYRIVDIGTRNYTLQYWWGEHFSTNQLATDNVLVVVDIRTVESEYKKADCYGLLEKAKAADEELFKNLRPYE